MFYYLLTVGHLFAVVAWMSGLLYLPRIFAYHAQAIAEEATDAVRYFRIMERRLYYYIMAPALIGVWLFGLSLMTYGGFYTDGWLHAKISIVAFMTGLHVYFGLCQARLYAEKDNKSPRFYKLINELPAVLLIAILILVVVKPF